MAVTPTPLTAESTIDEILHALITAGIIAASIFVKNPKSLQLAGQVVNGINTLLPIADGLLGQPPSSPQ